MKLKTGDRLGDWVVKKALGEGGMGSVYLCHSVLSDDVLAAVKVLIPSALGDVEQRFVQEMKTLAALNHPAIVRVLGGGRDEARGLLYMAMELVDGEDLEHRLARGPMSGDEVLAVFEPVLAALSYAHRRGVAHRDIKPANIMIRRDGTPVIVDFGIAVVEGQTRHTRAGMVPGTLMYLPPEVFQGETPDPKSGDAYALGVIMWEALTGKSAFGADPGTTDSQQMAQVMGKKMKAEALDTGPHTPAALREVILRTTDPEPESRLSDLEAARVRIVAPRDPVAAAPAAPATPSGKGTSAAKAESKPKRGGSWLWTGLLGVGALGLVGALVALAAVIVLVPLLWYSLSPVGPGPGPSVVDTDQAPPPHPEESWVDRAREALTAGKVPVARVHAERAFAENPEDPAAMLVLGEVLLAEGDTKGATPYLCAAKAEGLSPIPGVDDGKVRCGARPEPPPRPTPRVTPNRGASDPRVDLPDLGTPTPLPAPSTTPPAPTPPAATPVTPPPSSTPATPPPSSTPSTTPPTSPPASSPAPAGPIPGGKPKVTQTNLAVQGELDATAVKLVLQAKAPAIKRCYSVAFDKSVAQGEAPPQGTLAIKISIRSDGTIFSSGGVTVVQDTVGAGVSTCAAAALGGLIFPKDYGGNTVATWTFDMRVEV